MTTAAKIVRNPGEGHGLVRLTDAHFDALVKGQPAGLVPALVLLKPHGYGGQETAKGSKRHVDYELYRVEPFLESGDRDDAMWKVQSMYEARTSTGSQRPLPINLAGEERRQFLLERIDARADDLGLSDGELADAWREHHGFTAAGGTDRQFDIPGDYRKGGLSQLLDFALTFGAVEPEAGPDIDDEDADAVDLDEDSEGDED